MTWAYKYFTQREMTCKCGCGGLPKDSFMEQLEALREDIGFGLKINSGFRCDVYNRKVADSGFKGPHVLGLAADIGIYGEKAYRLLSYAIKHGFIGIGVAQKGPESSRYIHLDTCRDDDSHPRPWIWSY
jgi:uncharacterized protein YcbK (DUF882 family)